MSSHPPTAACLQSRYPGGPHAVLLAARSPWRVPVAAGVLAYQATVGAALAAWLLLGDRTDIAQAAGVCSLPLLLTAWLVWKADVDDRQFIAKLFAAAMFGPLLLSFWSSEQPSPVDAPVGPFMVTAGLLHLAAITGAVLGLGGTVTRVAAAAGVVPASARVLRERLLSLGTVEVPLTVEADSLDGRADAPLVLHMRMPDASRHHGVTLEFDAARSRVRVFEQTGTCDARPLTHDEARSGSLRDKSSGAPRPEAWHLAGTTWQTTMIAPQRLAALRLTLQGSRAELARPQARALDGEGVVTLLCAVATRSGWTWQPAWRGWA